MIRTEWIAGAMAAATTIALAAGPLAAEPMAFEIDEEHLSIVFFVDHMGYQRQFGVFREAAGGFAFDPDSGALSDLEVTIEADSVWTNHEKRDSHLRGGDFLAAKEFPEITFRMTGAEALTDRTGKVVGDLTLRGVTKPIAIDVTLNKVGNYPFGGKPLVVGISGRTSFRRSEFGSTYAVANGWVGDEIEIILEFEARKK